MKPLQTVFEVILIEYSVTLPNMQEPKCGFSASNGGFEKWGGTAEIRDEVETQNPEESRPDKQRPGRTPQKVRPGYSSKASLYIPRSASGGYSILDF